MIIFNFINLLYMTFCAVRIVEGKIFIIETMYTVIFKKKCFFDLNSI